MTLITPPLQRLLPDPGLPFVVYAIWPEEGVWKMAVANLPGGPLGEFAVSGALAHPLSQVDPGELPIALALEIVVNRAGASEWRFDFLGQSDSFGQIWRVPPEVQPNAPTPLTLEELNQGAEEMLRESIGIEPGQPIPEPAGPLPAEEQPDEPYRFDPTKHMDLGSADPAPPLPPPAPAGPPPSQTAQTFIVPPAAPPQTKQHGAYGDGSVPFAH